MATIKLCSRCGNGLVGRFSVTIFGADGSEENLRNQFVPEEAGRVVVAIHDSCKEARRTARAELRRRSSLRSVPRIALYRDLEVEHEGRTWRMEDVRVIIEGKRVLMFMPKAPYTAEDVARFQDF